MRNTSHPMSPQKTIRPVITSKKRTYHFLKWIAFSPLQIIPIDMWKKAIITAIFIFTELVITSCWVLSHQTGSKPNG